MWTHQPILLWWAEAHAYILGKKSISIRHFQFVKKDKETERQRQIPEIESLILWCQGSFALITYLRPRWLQLQFCCCYSWIWPIDFHVIFDLGHISAPFCNLHSCFCPRAFFCRALCLWRCGNFTDPKTVDTKAGVLTGFYLYLVLDFQWLKCVEVFYSW